MLFIVYFSICLLGAGCYGGLEILWRGHTHWSMLLAGGLCLSIIYLTETTIKGGLLKKALLCTLSITGIELLFGLLFNILLQEKVWDYSDVPLNFMGQICPAFMGLWFLLSCAVLMLMRLVRHGLRARVQ